MLFNSITFFVFFAIVYSAYLLLQGRLRWQNLLLLVASYVFYGWWDWRFLSLIALSTLVDFWVGRALGRVSDETDAGRSQRKRLLWLSVIFNLGVLGFFKYFNFFVDSFTALLQTIGLQANTATLEIILPVGISFYTFQTMSYTIDVYRKELEPTTNFINFATFVAFFPQLVAGPIERASNLLPQIASPRRITPAQLDAGLYLIIWGLFKKMVIGDRMAILADRFFNNYLSYSGLDLLIGVLAFTFQIYCDFSAYSDIARGVARLMGFELMVNFRLPYFAVNPSDFWNRWHISLSTWLRDYLYIPLGGNRHGTFNTYRNLFLTMLLGGLWHGAAWNFVIWGAYHGIILILYRLFERNPAHADPWGGKHAYPVVALKMLFMFILTLIGWLIFRSSSVEQIIYMLTHISLQPSLRSQDFLGSFLIILWPLLLVQFAQYISRDLLIIPKFPAVARISIYALFIAAILIYGVRESTEFIYFQF